MKQLPPQLFNLLDEPISPEGKVTVVTSCQTGTTASQRWVTVLHREEGPLQRGQTLLCLALSYEPALDAQGHCAASRPASPRVDGVTRRSEDHGGCERER